jgi:hypothetical protein
MFVSVADHQRIREHIFGIVGALQFNLLGQIMFANQVLHWIFHLHSKHSIYSFQFSLLYQIVLLNSTLLEIVILNFLTNANFF